jgi:hypothetical protein
VSEKTYTARAVAALTQAVRSEYDFAGWLGQVLAAVAGNIGSSDALTDGRPGSWESRLVYDLVKATVGDDEYLPAPSEGRKLTDAKVRDIKCRYWPGEVTEQDLAAEFGVSQSTISDIITGRTWGWVK